MTGAALKITSKRISQAAAMLAAAGVLQSLMAATVDPAKIPPAAERQVDFAKDIEPIFANSCYNCHGPRKQEASLRLDQKADALKGSENGPVILPRKSKESVLIQAVSWARDDLKMPKKG